MTDDRYLGIHFPFEVDLKGKYLRLNKAEKENIKSNLTFLITTMKGERYYKPDFGTNVMQYLFEPIDDQTINSIKEEVIGTVTKYMNNVTIESVRVVSNQDELFVGIQVDYSISTGVFKESDIIDIRF